MSNTPLSEENKELEAQETAASPEEIKDGKKKKSPKKKRPSFSSKKSKIPENETEEERKEIEGFN